MDHLSTAVFTAGIMFLVLFSMSVAVALIITVLRKALGRGKGAMPGPKS
jgi:hypothetical protein